MIPGLSLSIGITIGSLELSDTITESGTISGPTCVAAMSCFPGDVAGIILFLQPQDIVQVANIITSWPDRSGNANDATPHGLPAYSEAYLDGYGAASLTAGSSQYFSFPDVFSGLTSGEILIVVKSETAGITATLYNFSGAGEGTQELYPWSDTHVYEKFGTAARKDAGTPSIAINVDRLYNVRSASAAYSTHLNTVQQFSTGANTVSFGTHPAIGGGAGGDATPVTFFTGKIVEVIIGSLVFSSGDRTKLTSYLKDKYPSLGLP